MERAPSVAIVTTRDLTHDVRVLQTASALESAGLRVTVLARSMTGSRSVSRRGGVEIVRLAMPGHPDPQGSVVAARRPAELAAAIARRAAAWSLGAVGVEEGAARAWERENSTRIAELHLRIKKVDAVTGKPSLVGRLLKKVLWERIRVRQQLLHVRRDLAKRQQQLSGASPPPGLRRTIVAAVPFHYSWQRLLTGLREYEVSVGPFLDDVCADVYWAEDPVALTLSRDAVIRSRSAGRVCRLVYDVRDPAAGEDSTSQVGRAFDKLEADLVPQVDAVVAASEALQEAAARKGPKGSQPVLILDAPAPSAGRLDRSALRILAGVESEEPFVIAVLESLDEAAAQEPLMEALPLIPACQTVILLPRGVSKDDPRLACLSSVAAGRDSLDRLHLLHQPPPEDLVDLLTGADVVVRLETSRVGRTTIPRSALAAALAGVDLVTTPHGPTAAFVTRKGLGTVVQPEPKSLAIAVADALAHESARVRSEPIVPFTPSRQRETIISVCSQVLGQPLHAAELASGEADEEEELANGVPLRAPRRVRPLSLAIGPRNGNGQAWAWAEAIRSARPDVEAEVFAAEFPSGEFDMAFPCNISIGLHEWFSLDWQLDWARHALTTHTHVLLEQGLTALGRLTGRYFTTDLPLLRKHNIEVALVFRGSELRNPAAHAAREPLSPFSNPTHPLTQQLQEQVDALHKKIAEFDGPMFVTTLDLLDDLPQAEWLPQVLDLQQWQPGEPTLQRRTPIVLHAPSKERLKGSADIDAVCLPLHEAGLIQYRRVRGVPYREMPRLIGDADVLIDQFPLGGYGVIALQAMASTRLVIGHVRDSVRDRVQGTLPILEADPQSLRDVLMAALANRSAMRELADGGRDYVKRYHDGQYSGAVLSAFLGGSERD